MLPGLCACACVYVCVCESVCECVCVHACMCMYLCMCVSVCVYVCMCNHAPWAELHVVDGAPTMTFVRSPYAVEVRACVCVCVVGGRNNLCSAHVSSYLYTVVRLRCVSSGAEQLGMLVQQFKPGPLI